MKFETLILSMKLEKRVFRVGLEPVSNGKSQHSMYTVCLPSVYKK